MKDLLLLSVSELSKRYLKRKAHPHPSPLPRAGEGVCPLAPLGRGLGRGGLGP